MLAVYLFALTLLTGFTANLCFAQLSVDNPTDKKNLSELGLSKPIIETISDKGIYNITLKSGQSSPSSGLNFEIVFLNASFKNTNAPLPGAESNITLDNPAAVGLTVPSAVEHVIPVKSFDISITSTDGKEIFKKINEIPKGGRILENVNLNGYTGNLTVSLNNIVPDDAVKDLIKKQLKASNETAIVDSVKFQTSAVQS
jgi:hypothetical protein